MPRRYPARREPLPATGAPDRPAKARRAWLEHGAMALACAGSLALGSAGMGAAWASWPLAVLALGAVAWRLRVRLAEVDQEQARDAQLRIYRVAETLARADREEDLIRHALEAIALGVGVAPWAIYLHPDGRGAFALAATRGLPEEARSTLEPDPPGSEARCPASRAAWTGELTVTAGLTVPGLGAGVTAISMPLLDQGDLPAVLLCFLAPDRELSSEQGALLRWMAAQLSQGLKRLRLEQRDRLLASYLLTSGEILLGLDGTGTITHANAAAERALAAPVGALVGSRLDRIAAQGGVDAEPLVGDIPLQERVRNGGEFHGEVWLSRGDGSRFPAEVRLSPAYDRRGTPTGMVLVGRDISERHDHLAELERRREALARSNEQLTRLNAELEEAQRLQNDFLANTSHELRTPLNGVIGFATLLEQEMEVSPEERLDFARSIRESAEHLLKVINDLLDLAKVAAGRFQLQLTVGDLCRAVQGAVESLAPVAASKGISLRVDLPEEPLEAALDPARARQVVTNLLGNAVKFTDKGEVRIRAFRDAMTDEARIVVEDSGVGIPPELRARLFTRFVQVDGSYTRRHRGTGLGLAISRALVENMGGTIQVESEGRNRGTRVTLTFPAPIAAPSPAL